VCSTRETGVPNEELDIADVFAVEGAHKGPLVDGNWSPAVA
jgi:hypothetical protein